eukprot:1182349-Prorocentrum_minimum.AAC.1
MLITWEYFAMQFNFAFKDGTSYLGFVAQSSQLNFPMHVSRAGLRVSPRVTQAVKNRGFVLKLVVQVCIGTRFIGAIRSLGIGAGARWKFNLDGC